MYIASPVSGRIHFNSKCQYINAEIVKIPKHAHPNIGWIDSESIETSGSDIKNDCLRKVKRWVVYLCMNWKICDSDKTADKQRDSG